MILTHSDIQALRADMERAATRPTTYINLPAEQVLGLIDAYEDAHEDVQELEAENAELSEALESGEAEES